MKFIDKEHEEFYKEKFIVMQNYKKTDSYYKSIVYTLGICPITRANFGKIFNLKEGEINIDSLNEAWQTTSSEKVTRLAFSLWNGCSYDSEEAIEKGQVSDNYNVYNLFCCSYAPYFFEAIKVRYPEYTRETEMDNIKVYGYMRVGNIEQLDYHIEDEIKDKSNDLVGIYIRTNKQDADMVNDDIYSQQNIFREYCKNNNMPNIRFYIDVRKSGIDKDRKALKQMEKDIKEGKLNNVFSKSWSTIHRDVMEGISFLQLCNDNNTTVNSLQEGNISKNLFEYAITKELQEYLKDDWEEENEEETAEDDMEM